MNGKDWYRISYNAFFLIQYFRQHGLDETFIGL